MKKISLYASVVTILLCSCAGDNKKALAYHDKLMGTVNDIIYTNNHFDARSKEFVAQSIEEYDKQSKLTLDTINTKLAELNGIAPFGEGGDSLKTAMLNVGNAYRDVYAVCIRTEVDKSKNIPNNIEGLIKLTMIDSMFVSCNERVKTSEAELKRMRAKYAAKYRFRT